MLEPVYRIDPETLYLDSKIAAEIGKSFAEKYQSAKPYHHICIDNFLPIDVVMRVRQEALDMGAKKSEHESAQEHLKASYRGDLLPLYSRAVLNSLNSQSFLKFLEEMTGIEHLIPDPYFKGGGIHRTNTGGYLNIHADFNHHTDMNLERRINVLVYLNPDWKPEYGGAFEVWTDDMKERVAKFPPVMNRMCCFSTSSNSYHGNPEPVNHPDGDPRLSIALYYYTPTWSEGRVAHSTLFRVRPGSEDQSANRQHRRKVLRRYVPPIVYEKFGGLLHRLGF